MTTTTPGPANSLLPQRQWRTLRGGHVVCLREPTAQDTPVLETLLARLSPESRYNRFHGAVSVDHATLVDVLRPRAGRHVVLAFAVPTPDTLEICGGAQLWEESGGAQFSLVVVDAWQRRGVGTALLEWLLARASARHVVQLHGQVLAQNHAMVTFCRRHGFAVERLEADARVVTVQKVVPEWSGSWAA